MERMEDSHRRRTHRLGRAQGGRIVPVEGGGHIVRSTDRKDRHSKVSTAKGLRDRRVRLAAHTAIQFYDVQDRLGYDRPSKAVDWLIRHAKPAIDELALLPPWNPTAGADADEPPAHESPEKPAHAADFGHANFLPPEPFLPPCHRDLRLSLQSVQDPIFSHPDAPIPASHQTLFDIPWNSPEPAAATGVGAGYVFYSPAGESQQLLFTQRGPLQSSNSPSVRAWMDTTGGHQLYPAPFYPPPQAVPAIGFSSDAGGFSGFHLPARIQGEEEEEHGNAASSASHHHHHHHH